MNTSTCRSRRLSPTFAAGIWTLDWFMGKFTAHYSRLPGVPPPWPRITEPKINFAAERENGGKKERFRKSRTCAHCLKSFRLSNVSGSNGNVVWFMSRGLSSYYFLVVRVLDVGNWVIFWWFWKVWDFFLLWMFCLVGWNCYVWAF